MRLGFSRGRGIERAVGLLLALAMLVGILPPAAGAFEPGLALWTPSFVGNEQLNGGLPIEPGASYSFDLEVRTTVDVENATVAISRTELTVEIEPELFDLTAGVPETLRVTIGYPPEFPRRSRRYFSTRFRIASTAGPLAGAFLLRTSIADPEVTMQLEPPMPTEVQAGSLHVGQILFSTTRPLANTLMLRDQRWVTLGPIPQGLQPGEIGTIPVTVTVPLNPRRSLHSATLRLLNRGLPLKKNLFMKFNVKPIKVTWEEPQIELNLVPGEIQTISTSVTVSGDLEDARLRVKASDLVAITQPEGLISFAADVPEDVELIVRAPADPGNFRTAIVLGRGGETIDPPLVVLIRVRK